MRLLISAHSAFGVVVPSSGRLIDSSFVLHLLRLGTANLTVTTCPGKIL
jgi:hypothetical protein